MVTCRSSGIGIGGCFRENSKGVYNDGRDDQLVIFLQIAHFAVKLLVKHLWVNMKHKSTKCDVKQLDAPLQSLI